MAAKLICVRFGAKCAVPTFSETLRVMRMMDANAVVRPVPRWVRLWAILTVLLAATVIVLGGLVTSYRVGMSDPIWPTEPWFLVVNGHVWAQEPARGFLIEHTHRLAAWSIGVFATVLALAAWRAEPNAKLRKLGTAAVLFLLVAYLTFHGAVGAYFRGQLPPNMEAIPAGAGIVCGIGVWILAALSAVSMRTGALGGGLRAAATAALVGVMIQGLLGGYRVHLNQWMGNELAAIHGVFAQVVFVLLTVAAVLTAPRRIGDELPEFERNRLSRGAWIVVVAVFVQVVLGVWLRHQGSLLSQRLHLLTAFLVTGLIVAYVVRALATPIGRQKLGFVCYHLLGILAFQVMLGVEAWMKKLGVIVEPNAGVLIPVPGSMAASAGIRTAHVIIGSSLLAAAVVLALRVNRKDLTTKAQSSHKESQSENPNEFNHGDAENTEKTLLNSSP